MKKIVWIVVLALLPATLFAASPWTEKSGYIDKARGKYVWGFENAAFGWMEIFTQPQDHWREGKNVLAGVGEGLINAMGQTLGGALHAITFPVTTLDIPLPDGGWQFN